MRRGEIMYKTLWMGSSILFPEALPSATATKCLLLHPAVPPEVSSGEGDQTCFLKSVPAILPMILRTFTLGFAAQHGG